MDHHSSDTYSDFDVRERVGRNLKAARLLAGMTRQQLATRVGLTIALLSKIERGSSDPPLRLRLLADLAEAVGREPHELLDN
jgi:transcriptional regulator with XRE-family HTH domain